MSAARYFTACVIFLTASLFAVPSLGDGPDASPEKEKEQLAILQSDAPPADKAIACKLLAIHGSSEAVPDLAKLLPDPQLSSWARIALEAIPGNEADAALRKAAESLDGKLLVGTINSIGVRRDIKAVGILMARLEEDGEEVASAAAVALGRIGNPAASKALQRSLTTTAVKVRSAAAEGLVLCAERLHSEGKSAEAVKIYDEVRKADVPKQRVLEATRGAILARNQEGIPLLRDLLDSQDKGLFRLALSIAREFPGKEVDKVLAEEMAGATLSARADAPERAALMIQAMADRPQTVDLAAVLKAAGPGPNPVRLSAIGALARVGNETCLSPLLQIALEADAGISQQAKETLADLPGAKIDSQIVALLPKAEGKMYPLLIELVGHRRIEATAELIKALDHADKAIRSAALTSLGQTVDLDALSVLISQVNAPKHPDDAPAAQAALKAASVRMPDREACAAKLATALQDAPAAMKTILLEILGEVGGTKALETIGAASKSDNQDLQDAGSRLLGKWNSVDAAPVLLDLAKTGPAAQYRVRALRGYIGLARKFAMPEPERAEMCRQAFEVAQQPAEKKLVLDVLKLHPSTDGLKLAIQALEDAQLKDDATQATLVIAQKLGGKGTDVREQLSKAGLGKVKLEIIKAEYGAGTAQKDVTELLQKQAGDLPLITLPSDNYNASFGGDPAPGTPKQLKIQYKINGKAGEATFAENAVIILSAPK